MGDKNGPLGWNGLRRRHILLAELEMYRNMTELENEQEERERMWRREEDRNPLYEDIFRNDYVDVRDEIHQGFSEMDRDMFNPTPNQVRLD